MTPEIRAWAQAIAAGVPDELYWQLTPPEIRALLEELAEREARQERNAALRAGLVAAAIYNVHRRKGTQALKPEDFVRPERERVKILPAAEMAKRLQAWAEAHNKRVRA